MSETESHAWLTLVAFAELLPTALDAQLQRDADISHFEFMALSFLTQAPERSLRMSDLAAATNATLPRLSKAVSRMEQRHLVERTRGAADRRTITVRLTAEGRRVLVRALPNHLSYVRDLVLSKLSPTQITTLPDMLSPIVDALDPQQRVARLRATNDAETKH